MKLSQITRCDSMFNYFYCLRLSKSMIALNDLRFQSINDLMMLTRDDFDICQSLRTAMMCIDEK
jgi:hypothetical protein